ncbi:hypothetical protein LSH36_990g00030 [Paralvinella palmiformis]|uniref:NIDO domain-containing protein n=1 Tax=Paralvinella palmiformis TaxID=53620 RepID=A0AAD9IX38_9ANNE|nr:hypothetical protein LSH36_990g00030 [Paralvinella palmiformis]
METKTWKISRIGNKKYVGSGLKSGSVCDGKQDTFMVPYLLTSQLDINGVLSFGNENIPEEERPLVDFFPTSAARGKPPFLTSFWNDILLTGERGVLYYRQTTDGHLLKQLATDIAFKGKQIKPTRAVIMTWMNASSYDDIRMTRLNSSYTPLTMLNQGRRSSHAINLFASGSKLMLDLPDVCANAGVYGRYVIHTDNRKIQILDQPIPDVLEKCYKENDSLYPYGPTYGDSILDRGDEGPSGVLTFSEPATYYGAQHTVAYPWPIRSPVDDVTFMAAFWNDIFLMGGREGEILYRLERDPDVIQRFRKDVRQIGRSVNPKELLIATWSMVKAYATVEDDAAANTFQVVFGYEGNKSYTLFIYSHIGWYQDPSGHFAMAVFNKGASSGINLDVSPRTGPEYFIINNRGNSVGKPGMFVYETHPPIITVERPTCVCQLNKRKWVITYDGKRHPILHEQKTRVSKYLDDENPCKFQLTVYTTQNDGEDIMIKWVSFAFGVHEKNSKKFEKDIQMERFKNGTVVLRGRGHRGPEIIHPPWQWTSSDEKTQVFLVGDEWGGWVINGTFCPYRLQYLPNCPDPVIIFTIQKEFFKPGRLVGMCQDCNGDPENDYRPCSDDPVDDWSFWTDIPDVSKTCEESKSYL